MKTLIIRSDKLGDFYLSIPLINALKRKIGKENIDILISENIYPHFAKKEYLFKNIYLFPKKDLFKRVLLIFKLRNNLYDKVIVLDGKDRTLIFSLFLKSVKNIILFDIKKFNFFLRNVLRNKEKYLIIPNDHKKPYLTLHNEILKKFNVEINDSDFKIIKYENTSKINCPNSLIKFINNYTLLHVDEKWFSKYYINDYSDIAPKVDNFLYFIENLISKLNQNIVITTGLINLPFINELKKRFFNIINSNFYEYNFKDFKVILILKSSVEQLEIISMNSRNIILCQGALTQIAGSFNINLFDIIDRTREQWYDRHTFHINKYNKLFRKNFKDLSKEIILTIKQ